MYSEHLKKGLLVPCRPLLQLSDTFISMPILVHEFVDHAVHAHQMTEPQCLDRRSCLYRVLLPPDKLNPKVSFTRSQLSTRACKFTAGQFYKAYCPGPESLSSICFDSKQEKFLLFQILAGAHKVMVICKRRGYYDGAIVPFLTRATARTSQMLKGPDERSNPRELELPPPGIPAFLDPLAPKSHNLCGIFSRSRSHWHCLYF